MSIFRLDTQIADYPAYNVVSRKPDSHGHINIVANEQLIEPKHLSRYTVGSTVSYALENNRCPIESYNQKIEQGQPVYWINQNCTVLSDSSQEKRTYLEVDFEAVYMLEGKLFIITETANNNLHLNLV